MTSDVGAGELPERRGTIIKLFGAILVMLGVLDSLLTLRGGVPAYEFLLLIFAGVAVFCVGAVRGVGPGKGAKRQTAPKQVAS